MKCNNCGVDIQYKTSKCPICGALCDASDLTELFPKPPKLSNTKINKISINFCSLIAVLAVCLILLIINISTFTEVAWALVAVCLILLAYNALTFAFNNKYSLAKRNFISFCQTILSIYLIGYLLNCIPTITLSILPNIISLFTLINFAALVIFNKEKYFFSTLFFSVVGIIPIILYAFSIKISLVICICSISISVISTIISFILNRKKLKHLFTSFFHF